MPALPPPQTGAISFDVLAEIAVGATARVDLARATDLKHAGRLLAVKRLLPHVAEDPAFATEFLDEVWLTAALRDPHVVEVVGWGTDDEGTFLAVELVQGVSLARLMKTVFDTGEVFSERMVVFVSQCLCQGLAAAHALRAPNGELLSLVHRDLTPGNVLTSFAGDVKITDFGIAKAKQRLTRTLTGLLKGQPQYMAPELARGEGFDGRADLFSLGVVMFELFAGRRPWIGGSDFEVVQATAKDPPPDLRELRPKIDKELVAVVTRCLEKDPAKRFQSAREVEERLSRWLTLHGYAQGNEEALARFVRRNAMRQMRWFERAIAGELRGDKQRPSFLPAPPQTPMEPAKPTVPTPGPRLPPEDRTDVDALRRAQPHAVEDPPSDAPTHPITPKKGGPAKDDLDWGEEVPTLVHKRSGPLGKLGTVRSAAKLPAPRAKARSVPDRPYDSIVDDDPDADPDMRATTVKKRVEVKVPDVAKAMAQRPAPRPASQPPAAPKGAPAARPAPKTTQLPRVHEDEDQPTTPVSRGAVDAARLLAAQGADVSAVVPEPELGATVPQRSAGASAKSFVAEAERMSGLARELAAEASRLEDLVEQARVAGELAQAAADLAARAAASARAGRIDDAVERLAEARAKEAEARRADVRKKADEAPRPEPAWAQPARSVPPAPPPPQPSAPLPLVVRSELAAPPPRLAERPAPAPPAAQAASLDPLAFTAKLRPGLFGLSTVQSALAVTAAALLLVLVLWALLK